MCLLNGRTVSTPGRHAAATNDLMLYPKEGLHAPYCCAHWDIIALHSVVPVEFSLGTSQTHVFLVAKLLYFLYFFVN